MFKSVASMLIIVCIGIFVASPTSTYAKQKTEDSAKNLTGIWAVAGVDGYGDLIGGYMVIFMLTPQIGGAYAEIYDPVNLKTEGIVWGQNIFFRPKPPGVMFFWGQTDAERTIILGIIAGVIGGIPDTILPWMALRLWPPLTQ